MDDSAVSNIVRGTSITSGVCAFASGLYGIYSRQKNYGLLSVAAAVNSGVTAFAFFSIRELAISPLLVSTLSWPQYERRRQELGLSSSAPRDLQPLTWSELRQQKTLDSGISGALAGGLLRGWKSGPRAILPGALSIGAICTLLQMAYNEVSITRLRYISGQNQSSALAIPSSQSAPVSASSAASGSRSMADRLMSMFGVQQVTDEQYLAKLKATRDGHLKRIAELEKQLEEESQGSATQEKESS